MKAVEIDFVTNEKSLHWSRDRNKGNDWGLVLSGGLDG